MPPLPKRKFSKGRTRRKRAAKMILKKSPAMTCGHCGSPKLTHRACPTCGKYHEKSS
ncbi:MAG: 50S ribosomal protein L32 [Patescibacteria group bacterium]